MTGTTVNSAVFEVSPAVSAVTNSKKTAEKTQDFGNVLNETLQKQEQPQEQKRGAAHGGQAVKDKTSVPQLLPNPVQPAGGGAGQVQKPGKQGKGQASPPLADQDAIPPEEVAKDAGAHLILEPAAQPQAYLPGAALCPQGIQPLSEGQQ